MACNNTHTPSDSRAMQATRITNPRPQAVPLSSADPAKAIRIALDGQHREKTVQAIRDGLRDDRQSSLHRKWFQNIGEMYATKGWAAPALGIRQIGYTAAYHGIDHIGWTPNNHLAVFEVKTGGPDPSPTEGLKQLDRKHLESRLGKMQKDGLKQAANDNPLLGRLGEHVPVDRYLVHVGYNEQSVRVWEVVDGPDGTPIKGRLVKSGFASDYMPPSLYETYFEPKR